MTASPPERAARPTAGRPTDGGRCCRGFTLTELLVVLLILAIATGAILPVAHRIVESVHTKREAAAASNEARLEAFEAFIQDRPAPQRLSNRPEGPRQ